MPDAVALLPSAGIAAGTISLSEHDASNADDAGSAAAELYESLRAIAHEHMRRERAGHTLEATAVVNEAYVRLAQLSGSAWEDREHFLSIAAGTIRRVLVDHARGRDRDKRGGGARPVTLHSGIGSWGPASESGVDVLALDEALRRLASDSEQAARLVELRFFGGLSIDQAAALLGIGRNTAVRRWRAARAWLRRELGVDGAEPRGTGDAEASD
ncbi:MAG: ECF-type sigma factor [Planctomycetota bacterium]